jgi:glycosyltransferase involved in cell wall biosynthesis
VAFELERVVFDLAEALGQMGHDIFVLAPEGSKGEHFTVCSAGPAGLHNPEEAAYNALKPSFKDFDIIHDHSWAGLPYAFKREWPQLKLLHTIHSQLPYRSKPVEKPCFVAASQAQADYLKREVGFDCRVVHHGIDLSLYEYHAEKEDFLMYLNRVQDEKGALEFVALCKSVGMRGMLAGEDINVPDPLGYVSHVMRACENSGGLVRYLGRIPHDYKMELLQKARCVVAPLKPPYIEIFGLFMLEAMASGTPVLVTDQGAPRELVAHGVSGAIARDFTCLEANLAIALKCEPAACRRRAEDFPRQNMSAKYLELYRRMVEDGDEW